MEVISPIEIVKEAFGEREKSAVSALVEEYKVKWQLILLLEGEIKRWTASYIVALVIGIYWILSSERIKGIYNVFWERSYDNSYLILTLAVINASYSLAIAFKAYQIQQVYYYLHTVTGKDITKLIRLQFNSFEVWRRSGLFCSPRRIGKSEWRRAIYYPIITILPFGLSISILWMYIQYVLLELKFWDIHNIYFYLVVIYHGLVVIVAISTSSFNSKWEKLTLEELNTNMLPNDSNEMNSKLMTKPNIEFPVETTNDEEIKNLQPPTTKKTTRRRTKANK